jgi:hypothetical protein
MGGYQTRPLQSTALGGAGMLKIVHWIIVAMYLALPAGALTFSIWRWARTKKRAEVSGLVMTAIAGLALSTAMSLIYAAAAGGRVVLTQVGIGAYFAVGMLLLLKGV